jgi:ribosome biogenesis GTPase A
LLRRLFAQAGETAAPTVSRFPGTTQAAMRWHLERADLTIYDTPGFLPGDRLTDKLCPACAANLVPDKALSSKLYGIQPGQALIFGGWAAFALLEEEPRTFLAYAGDKVSFHRTRLEKAEELLHTRPDWLLPWACAACRLPGAWRTEEASLAEGEDLAVAGLGWISLRGGPARLRVILPDGVRFSRRPALFGRRKGGAKR